MKLLIVGASGKTGLLVVEQAVAAGHIVTAFVRRDNTELTGRKDMKVFIGDARSSTDMEKAMKDQDVVISTLGSSNPSDEVIDRSITAMINAASRQGVQRIVLMSSFLVAPNFTPHPIIKFALKLMGRIVDDFHKGEDTLRQSDLDYTIVYATRLTNTAATGNYHVVGDKESVGPGAAISRADVADFLITQVTDKTYIRRSIVITNK